MTFALSLAALLVVYGLVAPPWWAYVPLNLALAAGLVVVARRRGHTFDDLGMSTATLRRGAVIGLVAAAVVVTVIGAATLVANSDPEAGRALASRGAPGFLPGGILYEVLVRIPLGTALFEAIAFRGVIFASVRRTWSLKAAIAVSSIAFGLWHIGPTLHAVRIGGGGGSVSSTLAIVGGAILVTTLGGLLFAALRLAGRGLLAPALTHWSMNSVALIAAYAAAGGNLPFTS